MMPLSRVERFHTQGKAVGKIKLDVLYKSKYLFLVCLLALFLLLTTGLDFKGKLALAAFIISMILWIKTKLSAGFVAVSVLIGVILLQGAKPTLLYESFSAEVVWLMIGSYIIGDAFRLSGLADRITRCIVARAHHPTKLLFYTMLALQPLAFFIPSTSGRAAITLPIVKNMSKLMRTNNYKQMLVLLVPSIILMTTSASLIGAGSHLVGIELLEGVTSEGISYLYWLVLGAPFAFVISLITFFIIWWVNKENVPIPHLSPEDGHEGQIYEQTRVTDREKKTLYLTGGLLFLWLTESLHGYDIAFIMMMGAVLFMTPKIGILSWKQGIKAISWNLILFVAAATALGVNLVDTGVVKWLSDNLLGSLFSFTHIPGWLILIILLVVTITSHLYITSHTTRAVVMIPGLLLLSETLGLNMTSVVFLSLIGINFCLTFPVCSKALLIYYEDEEIHYEANDLFKLSLILMPVYLFTMLLFYFTYWKWLGLQL